MARPAAVIGMGTHRERNSPSQSGNVSRTMRYFSKVYAMEFTVNRQKCFSDAKARGFNRKCLNGVIKPNLQHMHVFAVAKKGLPANFRLLRHSAAAGPCPSIMSCLSGP